MRGVGNSVCAGFAVAVTALFGFLWGDYVAVAAAAAMRIHEELFGAKVVELSLYGGQHDLVISATLCVVEWGN